MMQAALEAVARVACHGLDERSLHVAGQALPFCARCTGLYVGVAAAVLGLAASGRLRDHRLPRPGLMALALAPWALSGLAWLGEVAGLDLAGNGGRAALGFLCGAGAAALLAPLWARVMWPDGAPARRSAGAAAGLAALAAALALAASSGLPDAARYWCGAAPAAAGLGLTIVALNMLLLRRTAWPRALTGGRQRALCACAVVVEVVALSAAQRLVQLLSGRS